jgi:hypothetical protein
MQGRVFLARVPSRVAKVSTKLQEYHSPDGGMRWERTKYDLLVYESDEDRADKNCSSSVNITYVFLLFVSRTQKRANKRYNKTNLIPQTGSRTQKTLHSRVSCGLATNRI